MGAHVHAHVCNATYYVPWILDGGYGGQLFFGFCATHVHASILLESVAAPSTICQFRRSKPLSKGLPPRRPECCSRRCASLRRATVDSKSHIEGSCGVKFRTCWIVMQPGV